MADVLPPQVAAVLQQANEAIIGLQQQVQQQQVLIEALQAQPAAQPGPAAPATTPRPKPNRPDTYDGRRTLEAAENFVFQHEEYFAALGMAVGANDAQKISFAAANLRGQAALWYRELKLRIDAGTAQAFANWADFASQLKEAFKPFNASRLVRDRLARAYQRTSVQEFVNELRNIRLHLPSLTDEELFDRFIRGLKYPIRKELVTREAATFEEAARIAERLDAATFNFQRNNPDRGNGNRDKRDNAESNPRSSNGPTPMELGAIRPAGNFPIGDGRSAGGGAQGKLTPELRQQLIKEGRCLFCREKGHMRKDCKKLQGLSRPWQ
jgi:hypothetical protein